MIKKDNSMFDNIDKMYKLQARISKCYINCRKDKSLYAVCLRFAEQISKETVKKHPINFTMIDFNATISLTIFRK